MQRERGGCAGIISFFLLLCLLAAVYNWPRYVDARGSQTTGKLTDKRESVRVHYGDWFRQFEIAATYSIPGQPQEHRVSCDVDGSAYDSLHVGSAVTVHYLPGLLSQRLLAATIPATHLAPCTSWAQINRNPAITRGLVVAFGVLLVLLALWKLLRIRMAAWLLIPWAVMLFAYVAMPEADPAPKEPRAAEATIESIDKVTNLLETNDSGGIQLHHPYQVVRLQFVPEGMDTPVLAVDKIDLDSIPDLEVGHEADIVYDAAHPRLARLHGGSREFPMLARWTVLWTSAALLCVILVVGVMGWLFGVLVRNPAARLARTPVQKRRRHYRRRL